MLKHRAVLFRVFAYTAKKVLSISFVLKIYPPM